MRLKPELEDVNLKNRTITAKLIWQPRSYDPHLRKWLHRIDVPTLLIWGANDQLFPKEYAFAYQRLIPGSSVTIIPECGHMPQIEQRAGFRRRARRLPRQQRKGPPHEILQLPSDAVPARRSRRDREERLGLGHLSNSHYDPKKGADLYHEYLDQMELADRLGFDGVCLNEHHQTAYGMMPIAGRAGRRARALGQARQDRHPRPRAAAGEQSAGDRRRIRDARQPHARAASSPASCAASAPSITPWASTRRTRRSASPRRTT